MVGEKTLCFSSQYSNPFTYLFGLNRNAKASSGGHYLQDKITLFNRPEMKESLDLVVCLSDELESKHVSGRGVVILAILSASNIVL